MVKNLFFPIFSHKKWNCESIRNRPCPNLHRLFGWDGSIFCGIFVQYFRRPNIQFFGGIQSYQVILHLSGHFCYFTEDLCLLLLCSDFRQMIMSPFKQQNARSNAIEPMPGAGVTQLPPPQMVEESAAGAHSQAYR